MCGGLGRSKTMQAGSVQVDINGMSVAELSELKNRIEDRVREMREVGGPALRERFAAEAAALGMTIEEIVETGKARRGRGIGGRHAEPAA
jgi:hypothetical protein